MSGREASAGFRVWALLGAHAGDNDQVLALAEAIGRPFETKQLNYNGFRLLGPRLLGSSLRSLSEASCEAILAETPPHLTISAGFRSVPVVRWLRQRSRGRTRSIHVGFPRVSPGEFDLVIATPQYPIPDHQNLLRIPYALTRASTVARDQKDDNLLARQPRPRSLLIVGGPNLFWRLDDAALAKRLCAMVDEARAKGGSVLVTTSPRTPPPVGMEIARVLGDNDVPFILAEPRRRPTLPSLLAAADTIVVTADSVSMLSDAISTGKPVELLPVKKSALGWVAFRVNDVIRPGHRAYPQDLRFFWQSLAKIGVSEQPGTKGCSTEEVMQSIMDRVRPIVESVE